MRCVDQRRHIMSLNTHPYGINMRSSFLSIGNLLEKRFIMHTEDNHMEVFDSNHKTTLRDLLSQN